MGEQALDTLHTCEQAGNFVSKAFCEGGWAMYGIAFVGVLVIFLIIERFLVLRALALDKSNVSEQVFGMILQGNLRQAIHFCDGSPAPLTNTLKAGLVQVLNKRPDEEVQVAMDASVLRESPRLEGWAAFLAVFGNVSVLIGLLGTIIGLITAFGGVAEADSATRAAVLSMGISHALNCTGFGLAISILAVVAYGYFQIRIGRATNDLLESSMNLMNCVVSNRDKLYGKKRLSAS